jgi:HlyD family secretion protein
LVVVGAIGVGGVALALTLAFASSDDHGGGAFFAVQRGPLVISVTEPGTIKNREQEVIKSEVEGRAAILTLVSEGTHVKPGDLLIELDSSRLEEQKSAQQITVINAEAAAIRARENLAVIKSQAESDVAKAELELRFAKLDLEKYLEGEHPQQLQQAEGDITIAREEVERAKEKLEWSKRLHAQRYLSRMELQADELALKKAELDLELAEGKKALLLEYTYTRDVERLKSDIEQASKALDRARRKASADVVQAEADLRARDSELARKRSQLAKMEDQIGKCRIHAPVAGMVVYATTGRGRWRGRDEPLQEGQEVREHQELIHLPTASSMMAEIKIHESSLEKVRVGLPVRITVDAAPGRVFAGKVVRIAVLPDSQSVWLNPDLKLYNSDVYVEGDGSDLRPGMSCRAEIFVERYEDAAQVPVQCVLRVAGRPTVFVWGSAGFEARPIKIGLDNNRMVHVLEGLAEGEQVLLSPPLESGSAAPAPEPPEIEPPAETPAQEEARPEKKPAASSGSLEDWQGLSAEERRKRFEQLTPEQRQKLMEQMRQRYGGRPGGSRPGADGE